MKITNVRVEPLVVRWADYFGGAENVPEQLWRPSANYMGVRRREGQSSILITVETDEGITGIGESWAMPDPLVGKTIAEQALVPLLIGQDPFAIDYLWEMMFQSALTASQRAFLLEAMSGIDIALWDLKGKALGLPIYRLIGGPHRERIETYASPVPFLPPRQAGEKALELVERGFRSIKLKIGRGIATDLEFVAAVRDAVGPSIRIVTDANCGFTVPQAIQIGRKLTELGVEWLEEPLPVEDRAGLVEVRQALDIAVVTGENEHSAITIRQLLELHAIDAVQINITRAGGITGALRIAALAHAFGIPMSPHGVGSAIGVSAILHVLTAIPNFWIYEYNQLLNPLRDELLVTPLHFADGYLHAPSGPGLGIELRADQLQRYGMKQVA